MNKIIKIVVNGIVLFLFLSCLFLSLIFIPHLIKSNQITWYETTGTVLGSYVKAGKGYCPKIKYKYLVNNVEYNNESVYEQYGCKLTRNAANKVLNNYTNGDAIKVYYSNDHSNSVLDKEVNSRDYFIAFIMIFLNILFLYLLFSKRAKELLYISYTRKNYT